VTQQLRDPTPPPTESDPRRWWALALLCGAFFMVILDAAIVTVALPSIEKDLGFSAQGLQWVVSAYALTPTEGFQSAFLAVAILAGIGVALALVLLGRPRAVPPEQLAVLAVSSLAPCPEVEPSPAPAGD